MEVREHARRQPDDGGSSKTPTYKNTLLSRLGTEITTRLNLRRVALEVGHEIEYPGKPITHIVFVEEGMASLTTTFRDGSQVEVGMFGYESVIGVSALMGTKRSLNRIYSQIPGYGYASPLESARREFQLGGTFHDLTLRYVQAQLVQAMQSAGCNAKHEIDRRLARWLLLCADRAHSNRFKLSQEYLASMLGASRPTVTVAAANFKKKGLIEYTRGTIQIIDSKRLQEEACECYHIIKDHLGNYAEFGEGGVA